MNEGRAVCTLCLRVRLRMKVIDAIENQHTPRVSFCASYEGEVGSKTFSINFHGASGSSEVIHVVQDGKQHGIGVFKTAKGDFRRGEWKERAACTKQLAHSLCQNVFYESGVLFIREKKPLLDMWKSGG